MNLKLITYVIVIFCGQLLVNLRSTEIIVDKFLENEGCSRGVMVGKSGYRGCP